MKEQTKTKEMYGKHLSLSLSPSLSLSLMLEHLMLETRQP